MKKRTFLGFTLLLMLLFSGLSAQVIFEDDFDPAPEPGWQTIVTAGTMSWETGNPMGGNGGSGSSNPDPTSDYSSNADNNVYGQGLDAGSGDGLGGYNSSTNEYLVSPLINCTGYIGVELSFWRYANFENNYDEAYVEISTDSTTWIDLGHPMYPQDVAWQNVTYDITAYAAESDTLYIRWRMESDGSVTYSGWNIDDVVVTGMMAGTPPVCASVLSPSDAATGIAGDMGSLNWNTAMGATGYKLYLGTDGGGVTLPTDIENGTDLGDVLSYDFLGLLYSTTYYWSVVPYNADGEATGCSIWSFTTMDDPTITVFPWMEDWETNSFLTYNWTNDDADGGEDWLIGTSTDYGAMSDHTTGSGYMAWIDDSSPDDVPAILISTPLDLTGTSHPILSFWYWIGSASGSGLSVDVFDGTSWNLDIIGLSQNTGWEEVTIDLNSYKSTSSRIRFVAKESTVYDSDIALDDILIREASTEKDVLTYSFAEQTGPAIIDDVNHTVDVEVAMGTDLTTLVADFTLSDLASATVATVDQVSGVTANDFSAPVTYVVMAEDSSTQDWIVTVTEALTQSSENDILTYTFPEATSAAVIDDVNHTVDIEVAWDADVTSLVAEFTVSTLATIDIAGTAQESTITANDFTSPVVYTVTAEDGTPQAWTVTVTIADPPVGQVCSNPIVIGSLPYFTSDSTGFYGDEYSTSPCDDNYMSGDEVIYTYTATQDGLMTIDMSNLGGTYAGLHVLNDCPDVADSCIASYYNASATTDFTIVDIPIDLDSVYYIVVSTWASPQSVSYDMEITFSDCPAPTALMLDSVNTSSAIVSWTTGGAANWNIEYGPEGFTLGTGVLLQDVTNPANISGLNAATSYDFYVQDSCGVGSVSAWIGPLTVTTDCGIVTAPYLNELSTGVLPTCWENISSSMDANELWKFTGLADYGASANTKPSGTFAWVDGSTPNTATDVTLITPWIDLSTLAVPQLTFELFSDNTDMPGDNMTLYVDVNDGLTWTNVYEYAGDYPDWQVMEVVLTQFMNDTVQVRFVVDQTTAGVPYNNDILLDSILIDEGPTCPAPTGLEAINIVSDAADIIWVPGLAANWNIMWDTTGFVFEDGNFVADVSNPYSLTGLQPEATYDVYVQDSCGVGDVSEWLGPITFTTTAVCAVPYNVEATNITDVSADLSWLSGASTLWDIEYGEAPYTATGTPTIEDVSANPYSLTGLNSSTTYEYYVRSDCNASGQGESAWAGPFTFTTLTCDPSLMCYFPMYFEDSYGDGWNGADVTVIQDGIAIGSYTFTSGSSYVDSVQLCEGASIDIEFNGGSFDGECSFVMLYPYGDTIASFDGDPGDGVFASFIGACNPPTCPVPTDLAMVTATDQSVTVEWTTGGATNWNIEYGPVGFAQGTGTYIADVTNPFEITGLAAEQSYDVYVQDSCASDDVSFWQGPLTVTTTGACPDPMNITFANATGTTIDVDWDGSFATLWDVEYGASPYTATGIPTIAGVSAVPLQLTGLVPQTTYEFYVRADCNAAGNDTSNWVGPITFETTLSELSNPSDCGVGYDIPDSDCFDVPIQVSGEGNEMGVNAMLTDVNFIITHTYDADLELTLESPSGVVVNLTLDNGSSDENYGAFDSTCVSYTNLNMTGVDGNVVDGVAPFIGSYVPEGDFMDFNDNSDPNGIWYLHVCDDAGGDFGVLEYLELVFNDGPVADLALVEPQSGNWAACDMGIDTIDIVIVNVGDLTIPAGDSLLAMYQINGGSVVYDTMFVDYDCNPGDSLSYQFYQTYDFSALGVYDWIVSFIYAGDTLQTNNTNMGTIEHIDMTVEIEGGDTIHAYAYEMPLAVNTVDAYDYYFWSNSDGTLTSTDEVYQAQDFGWHYVAVWNDSTDCNPIDSVFIEEIPMQSVDIATYVGGMSYIESCDLGIQTIEVDIVNAGTDPVPTGDTILVYYQVDGGVIVEDTLFLQTDLTSGNSVTFAFNDPYDFSALGTYSVEAWSVYDGDLNTDNDSVFVELNHIEISIDLDAINGGVNDTLIVTAFPATIDAGVGFDDYLWSTGETTQSIDVNATGWYSVDVYSGMDCQAFDSIYVDFEVGIASVDGSQFEIYPNPVEDRLYVNTDMEGELTYEIYNAQGQLIILDSDMNSDLLREGIVVRSMSPGVYMLRISSDVKTYNKTFIIK